MSANSDDEQIQTKKLFNQEEYDKLRAEVDEYITLFKESGDDKITNRCDEIRRKLYELKVQNFICIFGTRNQQTEVHQFCEN